MALLTEGVNHEVVVAQSPRLLYAASLGNSRDDLRNPNGVAALLHVKEAMNSRDDTPSSDPLIRVVTAG